MSAEPQTPPAKTRRTSTMPTPSSLPPSSPSSSEEGELTTATERQHLAAQISQDLQNATRDVMQKNARYFTVADTVCEQCGTKGHLSYDCPEEVDDARCFICGATDHRSRDCPRDACYVCRQRGHRARDCPNRGQPRRLVRRRVGQPRSLVLDCYVCGQKGHLDCSLEKMPAGVLSCYNCGMKGHAGGGCTVPSAERVIPIIMDMDRERRATRKPKKKGAKPKEETEEEKQEASMVFREGFLEKARQKRYRRNSGPSQ